MQQLIAETPSSTLVYPAYQGRVAGRTRGMEAMEAMDTNRAVRATVMPQRLRCQKSIYTHARAYAHTHTIAAR